MNVLELFAGSRSIGKQAQLMGYNTFSSDIHPFEGINYVTDILSFDPAKVPFIPDIIWASPPCQAFSVASIFYHWKIENGVHIPKTEAALLSIRIVQKTLDIITHFQTINPNLVFFIENPRGKLRKLPVISHLPRTTIMYCQYGDIRMKPTDIWSNNLHRFTSKICTRNNPHCSHQRAPRGSHTTGTQGLKDKYLRSIIPQDFCHAILSSIGNKQITPVQLSLF